MRIAKAAWSELSRLSVGEHPMPTLKSLLTLVEGRVPLLLEVKVEDDVWRWAAAFKRELGGYPGPFGVMSFDPRVARLRRRMPIYTWTIRTAAERAQAEVHADALIWEGDGRPRN